MIFHILRFIFYEMQIYILFFDCANVLLNYKDRLTFLLISWSLHLLIKKEIGRKA